MAGDGTYDIEDPAEKLAVKGSRNNGGTPRPGGGGAPPGPGGGFGGSFGGVSFGAASAPPAESFGRGPKRKIVMGPNGPISVAYSPMVADNVPAMLSPGEGVLNNGAMAQPGMQDFLQRANRQGAMRMAEGGVVPEPQDADEQGVMDGVGAGDADMIREMLMRLLPLLLGMDGSEAHMACGGVVKPQHMAFGGVAGQQGGFNRMPQMAPAMPRMPQAGSGGGGMARRPTNRFGRPGGGPTGLPAAAPPAETPVNQMGGLGGPQWGPQATPGSPNANLGNFDIVQRMNDILKQYGGSGAFGPEGNQQLLASLQGEASQNADALRQRARTNADVSGLDAGQRGAYSMQTDLNTQGGVANTLNSAKNQLLQSQNQFGQGLLNTGLGMNMQDYLARLAYEHQRLLGSG